MSDSSRNRPSSESPRSTRAKLESDNALSFEDALARLEAIVGQLDDGELPLAKALSLYKEGNALAKRCRVLLTEAEVEVKEALAADRSEREAETDS